MNSATEYETNTIEASKSSDSVRYLPQTVDLPPTVNFRHLRCVCAAAAKLGRFHEFYSHTKSLLARKIGPRQAIKHVSQPLLLYVEFFISEKLLDFCKSRGNVSYMSCPCRNFNVWRPRVWLIYGGESTLSTNRYSFMVENGQFRRFWRQL